MSDHNDEIEAPPTSASTSAAKKGVRKAASSYPIWKKLQLIAEPKETKSINATAKKHNVDRKRIREWMKQEVELQQLSDTPTSKHCKRLDGAGRPLSSGNLEDELFEWYQDEYVKNR